MRNIKITIEYDGKNYAGWQMQPNKPSVQEEITNVIKQITGEEVEVIGSGRTDAGVHALGQVANFHIEKNLDIYKIIHAINAKLPKNIVVKNIEEVDERFHARYNCKQKTYRYVINNNDFPSALDRYREFHISKKLSINNMKRALEYFKGEHDFKGFKSSGGNIKKSTVRTITNANIREFNGRIIIELTGDGFLYNMVRIISGTIVDVGLGKIKVEDIPEIIESGDRTKAGRTLPPQGLYLVEVFY